MEERHSAILKMLAEAGSITTAEIQRTFGISYDSAKRDLRILEERGELRRTHGGAIPVGELAFGRHARAFDASAAERNAVAELAAELVCDNETVYVPSDENGLCIVKKLPAGCSARVVTNSVRIAEELRRRGDVRYLLLGGEPDLEGRCHDSFAVSALRSLRLDRAYISAAHISAEFGLSLDSGEALTFYGALFDSSRRVVGLCGASAIDTESTFSLCPAARLHAMLCDSDVDAAKLEKYGKLGIRTVISE